MDTDMKNLQMSAADGDPAAQTALGECYLWGLGVPKNHRVAMKWFRKAAKQGYAEAQNKLGHGYAFGWGVRHDKKKAVEWYTKAVKQGHCTARIWLRQTFGIEMPPHGE